MNPAGGTKLFANKATVENRTSLQGVLTLNTQRLPSRFNRRQLTFREPYTEPEYSSNSFMT